VFHQLTHGFLTFFCAMDPLEGLMKLNCFSEKYIYMHKKVIVNVLKLANIFWSLEAMNYIVAYIHC
jgi:hypothetical protein